MDQRQRGLAFPCGCFGWPLGEKRGDVNGGTKRARARAEWLGRWQMRAPLGCKPGTSRSTIASTTACIRVETLLERRTIVAHAALSQ